MSGETAEEAYQRGRREVADGIVGASMASPALRALVLRCAAGILAAHRGSYAATHSDWADETSAELTLHLYAHAAEASGEEG